jgi:dTDP-glucose 4,6-dehydratase
MKMRILITGGAGFIGSALVQRLLQAGEEICVVDSLTYAANPASLDAVRDRPGFRFVQKDICDTASMRAIVAGFAPTHLVHLAAETHVDRSITGSRAFVDTNILGTHSLLEAVRAWLEGGERGGRDTFRLLHVSTDEVFGSLGAHGAFSEQTKYDPSSPYSATKAAADHLVLAWHRTYGVPAIISNCSNNFGPRQFPEKLIPLAILNALEERPLPIYGDGSQVRDWLYVEDHAAALCRLLDDGIPGETYCVGGRAERSNLSVVEDVCALLDERRPRAQGRSYKELIMFVRDRPGHDQRYAIDPSKIERQLSWKANESFESGLQKTVDWYLANPDWWRPLRDTVYAGERLGLLGRAE